MKHWFLWATVPLVFGLLGFASGAVFLTWSGLGLCVALLAVGLVLHRHEAKALVTGRRFKALGSDGLHLALALSLAVLAWAVLWVGGFTVSYDITANRQNSLDPLTVKILKGITRPTQIEYHSAKLGNDLVLDTVKRFCKAQTNLTWYWVDMVKDPLRSKERGVDQPGTLVLVTPGQAPVRLYNGDMIRHGVDGQGRPVETDLSEEKLVSALQHLSMGAPVVLGFLVGDGEKKLDDGTEGGLARLRETLRLGHFRPLSVKELTLETNSFFPVLAVVGPREPLSASRKESLLQYLAGGGHLFLCLDPAVDSGRVERSWEDFARQIGVVFRDDMVVDPADYLTQVGTLKGSPVFPILNYGNDPITATLKERQFDTVFFTARSIQLPLPPNSRSLLTTGGQAMGIGAIPKPGAKMNFDPLRDVRGALPLGVAFQHNRSRVIALGDSDFLRNPLLEVAGHRDLSVALFRHLAGLEGAFVLPMRPPAHAPLVAKESVSGLARFLFLFLLPAALLGAGIARHLRRRRMGKG